MSIDTKRVRAASERDSRAAQPSRRSKPGFRKPSAAAALIAQKSLESSSCESKLDSNLVALVLPGVPRLPERADVTRREARTRHIPSRNLPALRFVARLAKGRHWPRVLRPSGGEKCGLGGPRGGRLWLTTCRWVVSPSNDRRSSNSFSLAARRRRIWGVGYLFLSRTELG